MLVEPGLYLNRKLFFKHKKQLSVGYHNRKVNIVFIVLSKGCTRHRLFLACFADFFRNLHRKHVDRYQEQATKGRFLQYAK